jgi:hypothetical protein
MERISKVLQLDIADSTKAKHLIILCKEHPELYESITDLLIDRQQNSLLSLFLTEYDESKEKLRRSKWTYEQLDYFKIDFQNTSNTEDICPTSQINENAQRFLHDNKDIDGYFELTEESQISSVINTAFKGYLLYVQKSPSSCVDDAVRELLQKTLGNNFLVKTRYDMTLSMSNGSTKATADVLAIFIPKLYMGVIIVEDKTNEQHSDAEAQMVAEALAIVQQKRWPLNKPIFMLRVLETNITFYKACFTNELISSVTKGQRRLDPFFITRLEYRNPLFTNDRPGYNVLKRKDREIIVSILSNIGYHISHMF